MIPGRASATHLPTQHCAADESFCTKAFLDDGVRKLRLTSTAFSGGYDLCVTGPDEVRACKRFSLTEVDEGRYRSVVTWRQHFEHNDPGAYRVTWHKFGDRLGKVLGFHHQAPTSTGVSATTVKIGLHAPLTGPDPLPSASVSAGKDQYWMAGNGVAGRDVKVVLRNDQGNGTDAARVCRELVEVNKVFVLVGSGGALATIECARIAAAAGVPYVSAGGPQKALGELANYFALSQTYRQQMQPLMQYIDGIVEPQSHTTVAIVASNIAPYDEAVKAFKNRADDHGLTPVVYRPSASASDAELAGVAQRMVTDGVTAATPLIPRTQWIKLASNPQVHSVEWHGVGVTQGFNAVAQVVCPSSSNAVDGATFFSPWPGRNLADDIDPEFTAAGGGDDVQWALWGLNRTLHAVFKKMGGSLTRRDFRGALTGDVASGIYPNLAHTDSNHFRAQEVHQVTLNCADRRFESTFDTIFKTGF